MSFSRDLPDPGIEPRLTSPALAGGFFSTSATWGSPDCLISSPFYTPDNLFSFFEISLMIGLCHSQLMSYPNLSIPNDDIWNSIIKIQVYGVLKKNIQTQDTVCVLVWVSGPACCLWTNQIPGGWIPANENE